MIRHIYLLGLLLLCGCSSSNEINGHVTDRTGTLQGGVLIRLISIDDAGKEVAEVDKTLTDRDGGYVFSAKEGVGSALVLQAELPSGSLRAFAAGENPLDIDVISDALVTAIVYVTQTSGGRSLSDFTREELASITKQVRENIDAAALDETDASAVVSAVIAIAGRTIPDAAGGKITAVSSVSIEPADATVAAPSLTTDPSFCSRPALFVNGDLFQFDLIESGALCHVEGVSTPLAEAFNIGLELSLVGDTFVDPDPPASNQAFFPGDVRGGTPARSIEDYREFVFGPAATAQGLQVTRKIYIPTGNDWVRYLEVLTNPTASDVTVSVQLSGEYGLRPSALDPPPIVFVDSGGNRLADSSDDWAAEISNFSPSQYPSVGFLWNTEKTGHRADEILLSPDNPGAFLLRWDNVTVPAMKTRTVVMFTRILSSLSPDRVVEQMEDLFFAPDFTGMNSTELSSLENMRSTLGNIVGEAGSVASGAEVTATNSNTSAAQSVTAAQDGSFAILLTAQSGESITVSATDGYSSTFVVP